MNAGDIKVSLTESCVAHEVREESTRPSVRDKASADQRASAPGSWLTQERRRVTRTCLVNELASDPRSRRAW